MRARHDPGEREPHANPEDRHGEEQDPPVGELGDRRGQRQPECAADAHGGTHQRDRFTSPLPGKDVVEDRDSQRHHSARDPLQAAPENHHPTCTAAAASSEPAMKKPSAISRMSFFPYMSASRPLIGVEIAPARSVIVMIHEARAGLVSNIAGSSPLRGTMRVCSRETSTPPAERTTMSVPGRVSEAGEVTRRSAEVVRGTRAFYS